MQDQFSRKVTPHFHEQCRSRGITTSDTQAIYSALARARAEQDDKICEFVKRDVDGEFWRFWCIDGQFYAVFKPYNVYPSTVYTQDMIGSKKYGIKQRRRGMGKGPLPSQRKR